jgi:cytochrome c556
MRRTTMLFVAAATVFAGSAVAANRVAAPDAVADTVAGRQAAFRMSGALFGGMRAASGAGGDVKAQAFAARALAGWAKAIPGMFPAGSAAANSAALPNVWTDRAGFEAKAADYAAAATKLGELAKAGDSAGFAAQLVVVGKTCGACHDGYRKPEEHRPG